MGEQGQKVNFCGTTLFAELLRPLCPVPTHRLPVNAGNASKDTEEFLPVPLALGGPFAESLFAPLSAIAELSVDALSALPPPLTVSNYDMPIKHDMCPFVKNYFSQPADIPYSRKPAAEKQSSDKKGLNFPKPSAIIPSQTQDSYIGNTTASQAVKAGSTPVSCSKRIREDICASIYLLGFLLQKVTPTEQ